MSLSDFKWKSASYLDNHGVLCETHKFSREPATSICDVNLNSKYGALYGEYKLSPVSSPAGNLFDMSSRQSAAGMEKCFQLVECGKQHPIMFIQITTFDLSLVSYIGY